MNDERAPSVWAYFDETGHPSDPDVAAFGVCGLRATCAQWLRFTYGWNGVLASEGIQHFHMKNFCLFRVLSGCPLYLVGSMPASLGFVPPAWEESSPAYSAAGGGRLVDGAALDSPLQQRPGPASTGACATELCGSVTCRGSIAISWGHPHDSRKSRISILLAMSRITAGRKRRSTIFLCP